MIKTLVNGRGRVEICLRALLLFLAFLISFGIWLASNVLDNHIMVQKQQNHPLAAFRDVPKQSLLQTKDIAANTKVTGGYILFHGVANGQGAGNLLQGLLAAQLLGLEYNRTVCVDWDDFMSVFDYADTFHKELCDRVHNHKEDSFINMWNFGGNRLDECALAEKLADKQHIVVSFKGNTYPAWRTDIPPNIFFQNYRAKQRLIDILPYASPPQTVVHFRAPDGKSDQDRGLDEESLVALGQKLAGNGTYLVTNRPDWYRRFRDCCGWTYDQTWLDKPIEHGGNKLTWNTNGKIKEPPDSPKQKPTIASEAALDQNLKLFSDWYTMLNAKQVFHSKSDFSGSAVHWNPKTTGYELNGMKDETIPGTTKTKRVLNLQFAEYDRVPFRVPPLVERKLSTTYRMEDTCEYLRFCRRFKDGYYEEPVTPKQMEERQRIDALMKKLQGQTLP